MNATEAKQILNNFGSAHEHKYGKYYADFNIKVYTLFLPKSLTDKEREYIESSEDAFEEAREGLLAEISAMAPVMVTGRSGGWITVEWDRPSTDSEIITIARDIETINNLVKETLAYVRSEEFWLNFVEGVDPKPSENYKHKTKLVTSIVLYTDQSGYVLSLTRTGGKRKYYYHKRHDLTRALNVLNSDTYTRRVKMGKVSNGLFIFFEKK